MIRYLIVLYLGVASIVLLDPNPLWSLPLVVVLIGLMWDMKWLSLTGIGLFSLVTVGRADGVYITEGPELLMFSVLLVIPIIVLIDIMLAPRPYRTGRVSVVPILAAIGMIAGMAGGLMIMVQVRRIGLYFESDPTLQVFLLISLSILFTGPFLLGSRTSSSSRKGEHGPKS